MHLKDKLGITIIDHILIKDLDTEEILVNQRGTPMVDLTKMVSTNMDISKRKDDKNE
jgi:hypothetical protein